MDDFISVPGGACFIWQAGNARSAIKGSVHVIRAIPSRAAMYPASLLSHHCSPKKRQHVIDRIGDSVTGTARKQQPDGSRVRARIFDHQRTGIPAGQKALALDAVINNDLASKCFRERGASGAE